MLHKFLPTGVFFVLLAWSTSSPAVDQWGLKTGSPDLKSAGPLAFGPDGILFVGDTKGAAIFAIATDDTDGDPAKAKIDVTRINETIADSVSASPSNVDLVDMAVNPLTGNIYFSVAHRSGTEAVPALVRVDAKGKATAIGLKRIRYSKVVLPNPPEDKVVGEGRRRRNRRADSITDLAFAEGKVLVSGLTSQSSPSTVREIAFPFADADPGVSVEIYHGAHGRFEDYAPAQTFVPFNINGQPNLLAGFVCTPLVRIPLESLSAGKKVRGTTVAELGNRNRPLDMIVYEKDGDSFLLLSNSARGVMKISTKDIGREEGITERVGGDGTGGQAYETVENFKNVVQLDRLNDQSALVLVQNDDGSLDLRTLALP